MSDVRGGHDGGLTEDDLGPDPIEVFLRWFGDARHAGILFPEAVALATVRLCFEAHAPRRASRGRVAK